jgi:NitT/TauT family transport system substrate-binding protein
MLRAKSGALVVALCLAAAMPAMAEDILVTQYKADPSGAPWGVALEKGMLKKAGLDITGIVAGAGGGSSVRSALASSFGYGEVAPAGVITAIDQGQDLKIVNYASTSLADLVLIVMPDSPIKSVKDLKNKKLGISNPKSLGELMGVLVMEKAGLAPTDLKSVALGSLSGALTAMENGVVDTTSIPLILFHMRGGESKYRVVVGPNELPLIPPEIGIATTELIAKHPDKLRALLAARREAVKFIYEHTPEAIEILSKVYEPLPPKDVARMVKDLVAVKFWSEGNIDMSLLENTVRGMKYVGMITKDVDLNKMVDRSFLPSDLQK